MPSAKTKVPSLSPEGLAEAVGQVVRFLTQLNEVAAQVAAAKGHS